MAKIFYSEMDNRDFHCPDKYAFLNWRMDDGLGTNQRSPEIQMVSDNYYMGRGYLGNALLSLFLLAEKNRFGVADIVVFPILFDIWHGTELWLKSACKALDIIFQEGLLKKKNHDIYDYYQVLDDFFEKKNFQYIKENALPDVGMLVSEFKKVNANFDFARYSFDSKDNYQFYNAPYGDKKQWQKCIEERVDRKFVPNTCLDLMATFELVLNMFVSFGRLVECLNLIVDNGKIISDQGYRVYVERVERTDEMFETSMGGDIWEKLLDIIN